MYSRDKVKKLYSRNDEITLVHGKELSIHYDICFYLKLETVTSS